MDVIILYLAIDHLRVWVEGRSERRAQAVWYGDELELRGWSANLGIEDVIQDPAGQPSAFGPKCYPSLLPRN